jgi:hypothetical protein
MVGALMGAVGLLLLLVGCGPDNADFLPYAYPQADAAADAGEAAWADSHTPSDVVDADLADEAAADAGLAADGSTP